MIFFRARSVVGQPEVRFAHPVRLPPDTRYTRPMMLRNLQIAVYQTFNQNQSYDFHNSENA